jgi:cell division protein FtsL
MPRADFGNGRAKAILAVVVVAALAYAAAKLIPPYVNNYQLQDHIRQIAIQAAAGTRPTTPAEIQQEVIAYAQDLGLSLEPENVTVTVTSKINVELHYTVPVNLMILTWSLDFTPSAEARPL